LDFGTEFEKAEKIQHASVKDFEIDKIYLVFGQKADAGFGADFEEIEKI
jgi:hypothetical protein